MTSVGIREAREAVASLTLDEIKNEVISRARMDLLWTDRDTALHERLDREAPGWIRAPVRRREP